MKRSKTFFILITLLITLTTTTHAAPLIQMITGGGRDRGPQTNGKVTVKGLSKYEGKFVMGLADTAPAPSSPWARTAMSRTQRGGEKMRSEE